MPTENPRVTITLDDELLNRITEYRFENRIKNQTQAIVQLVEKGIAEIDLSNHRQDISDNDFSQSEIMIIQKYRSLDDHGKKNVGMLLENEYQRCTTKRNEPDEEKALATIEKLRGKETYRFVAHGTTSPENIELTAEEVKHIQDKLLEIKKMREK